MPSSYTPNSLSSSAAALCAVVLCAIPAASPAADQAPPTPGASGYKLAATWKPGGEGGWDYLTIDPVANRLYIAREDRIQVIDTTNGMLLGEVPGVNGAHGVVLVPGLNRGFATSGKNGTVIAFDLVSLKVVGAPITVGQKPDAIAYDTRSNRVFSINGGSHDVTVIDPATSKVAGAIPLPGAPEFAVSDGAGMLFVNLEDKSQVVQIDTQSMKVKNSWALFPGDRPTGLAIDPTGHHLFSGCGNKHMMVLDDTTGTVVGDVPIGSGVDATRFDPGSGYAFSSNGDGTLTVVEPDGGGHFKVLDNVPTKQGARTMALDPRTHAIYLCTADFPPRVKGQKGRPKAIPGSFVVLKFTR